MSVIKGRIHHIANGGVGGAVAAAVAAIGATVASNVTKNHRNTIPANEQKTWQRCGAGLAAAFSLACGIGAGVWVHNRIQTTQPAPETATTQRFNVETGANDECILVVKGGEASALQGPCTITPSPR